MEQYLFFAILVLLVVVAALLIVLLVRQNRSLQEQKSHQHQQSQYLQDLAYDLFDELDRQRDEHAAALSDGNANLLNTLTQLGQSQSSLLESMQRQVLLSTRNQEERAGQMAASVTATITQLDTRMESLRQANDRQLSEMRRTVDEKLTESIDKRLNDSFAQVSQRLEQVYKSLGEMQSLAVGMGDLKKVLTNVKTRGIWGEMQLGSLLSAMLAPNQYDENVAVVPGATERVEFAVRLPGKDADVLYLPIDSKFPQEDYLRLVEASQSGDAEAADAARKALLQRIRQEAKRIAGKYIVPPHTTDFAIMFLPIEGLYAELAQTPELCESLQKEYRVVVAGPSTFTALLNALQMGFRTLAIEKRSSEVWSLLGAVKNDFDKFADVLEKTRQRLVQATESIDTAFTRTRSIQRRLGAVETPED
ncbi:MAG: DNA recombination protein RmuC [Clostridia bacterium]|nr:DNA recombination protein RmuC [Clostridia bacterium]